MPGLALTYILLFVLLTVAGMTGVCATIPSFQWLSWGRGEFHEFFAQADLEP
jgi:hypothetical protein